MGKRRPLCRALGAGPRCAPAKRHTCRSAVASQICKLPLLSLAASSSLLAQAENPVELVTNYRGRGNGGARPGPARNGGLSQRGVAEARDRGLRVQEASAQRRSALRKDLLLSCSCGRGAWQGGRALRAVEGLQDHVATGAPRSQLPPVRRDGDGRRSDPVAVAGSHHRGRPLKAEREDATTLLLLLLTSWQKLWGFLISPSFLGLHR